MARVGEEEEGGAPAEELRLPMPDDLHVHLRDGDVLRTVAPLTARRFGRAVVMPNLVPSPVRTADDALAYRGRVLAAAGGGGGGFEPLMTLYLTDNTGAETVAEAVRRRAISACKLYPAGATTNSALGVSSLRRLEPALRAMEQFDVVLAVHGEVVGVDMFERERAFVREVLPALRHAHPRLRVVLEHVSSAEAVEYVLREDSPRLGATVTPQHLSFDRGALFAGSRLRHHMFCLPILKREADLRAIRGALARGSPRLFAGTDSAPHLPAAKADGAAGVFCAPAALELYAQAFDEMRALAHLPDFLCRHGANFYGLPLRTEERIRLHRTPFTVPESVPLRSGGDGGGEGDVLVPMCAGQTLDWTASVIDDGKS